MRSLRAALPAWLAAHLIVGFALVADAVLRSGTDLTREPVGTRYHSGLLSWDASWFLRIADQGYERLPQESVRFFPGIPLVVRMIGGVVGSDEVVLVAVAWICGLLFLAALYDLVREDFDEALARRATWLAAVAPLAFVLVMGYAEAPTGLAIVLSFRAARRGRWAEAAVAGAIAGILRPLALLLVVPLFVEALRGARAAGPGQLATRAVAVVSPLLGAVPYVLWVQAQYGDWRLPYRVQTVDGLRGDPANPITVVADALRGLDGSDLVLGTRGLWALVFVGLAVVAAKRLPLSYTAFAVATLLVATSTEHVGSLERYAFSAFPFIVAASTLTKRPNVERVTLLASAGAMACYAILAFADIYVP